MSAFFGKDDILATQRSSMNYEVLATSVFTALAGSHT
jgi:hypothetical protein